MMADFRRKRWWILSIDDDNNNNDNKGDVGYHCYDDVGSNADDCDGE